MNNSRTYDDTTDGRGVFLRKIIRFLLKQDQRVGLLLGLICSLIYFFFWIWISPSRARIPETIIFSAIEFGIAFFTIRAFRRASGALKIGKESLIAFCFWGLALKFALFGSPMREYMLITASFSGKLPAIKLLLTLNANPNAIDSGKTPLIVASEKGDEGVVIFLINHGANPNQTVEENSPLNSAIRSRHSNIATLLRSAGAKR